MSTCMYCGAQLAPGAMGCGRCGRPVAQQQQQQQWQQPPQQQWPQSQQPQQPYPQQGYAQPPQQQPYGQPQQPYGQPQQPYAQPPQQPAWQQQPLTPPQPAGVEWKWGYSRWVGIHYGPIPIGIIIAIIVLAAYSSSR